MGAKRGQQKALARREITKLKQSKRTNKKVTLEEETNTVQKVTTKNYSRGGKGKRVNSDGT